MTPTARLVRGVVDTARVLAAGLLPFVALALFGPVGGAAVALAIMLGVLAWRLPGVWGDGFR